MNFLDKNFGRMGNRMFQMAALYKYAKMNGSDIYFQDPKWFEGCEEEIKQLFKQEGEPLDYIAIHVRRGKNPANPNEPAYSDNPFYVVLSKTDYYKTAIRKFPNGKFLVFSDDIPWCKDYFCNDKVDYSEGNTEIEDFNLMTRCKHHIIANSSFSWWAAYLNPNPDKKVIYPKNWYADGMQRTICPQEWTAL